MICRDTGTIERHIQSLVSLLESCLQHDLKPGKKDEDPPHAKIASDVISCIFLNHQKRNVLELAMPVAIKLLHRGNRELSRNLSSYLSLAAINHAEILAPHVQPLIDSIIGGNHTLAKVLPKIYSLRKEPIQDHVMALVCLLPQCDTPEKLSLLNLFALIAKSAPRLLESNLPELSECLCHPQTAYPTLQIFLHVAQTNAKPFMEHLEKVIRACELQHGMLSIAAQFIGLIGRQNSSRAVECVDFLSSQLSKCDLSTVITILREIRSIAEQHPNVLPPHLPRIVAQTHQSTSSTVHNYLQQLGAICSQCNDPSVNINVPPFASTHCPTIDNPSLLSYTNRSQLNSFSNTATVSTAISAATPSTGKTFAFGSSLSNRKKDDPVKSFFQRNSTPHWKLSSLVPAMSNNLPTSPNVTANILQSTLPSPFSMTYTPSVSLNINNQSNSVHRSVPRLLKSNDSNVALASGRQLSCSMGRVHRSLTNCNRACNGSATKSASSSLLLALQERDPPTAACSIDSFNAVVARSTNGTNHDASIITNSRWNVIGNHFGSRGGIISNQFATLGHTGTSPSSHNNSGQSYIAATSSSAVGVLRSHSSHSLYVVRSMSQPTPARDGMRTFCEKHLDKVKAYMERFNVRLPLPIKCTIEQRKSKKVAKLHFTCDLRSNGGHQCLFSRTSFCVSTRNARTWIHLMFLALQSAQDQPLYSSHPAVQALASCWQMLCKEPSCASRSSNDFGSTGAFISNTFSGSNGPGHNSQHSFLTLVTGAFPTTKQHEQLLLELRAQRYFDVFEFNAPIRAWNCFICNHPKRAGQMLHNSEPIMQGQLKEKRAKWKLFRRWRTRYFTLSGTNMSYRELVGHFTFFYNSF